jgi:PilZ domain
VTHLAELLQTYRDSPPEEPGTSSARGYAQDQGGKGQASQRRGAGRACSCDCTAGTGRHSPFRYPAVRTQHVAPSRAEDRRRYPRMKCFVVVELRTSGSEKPSWGNLVDISLGGCFVGTPATLESGAKIGIGLWVASSQIWVKGLVLDGIVARTSPTFGLRVKFAKPPSARPCCNSSSSWRLRQWVGKV